MNTFWNVIWIFPYFGWIVAIFYGILGLCVCATVVGLPLGLGILQYSKFLFWPHGNAMISKADLEVITEKERPLWWRVFAMIVRIIYFPFGVINAIMGVLVAAVYMLTIIGIPNGLVLMKSIGTLFNPVNKVCVPAALVNEIERTKALRQYAPVKTPAAQNISIDLTQTMMQSSGVQPTVQTLCPNCGNALNTNSKFCPNCGTAITVGQQPSIAESPSGEQSAETLAPPTPISASTPPSTSTPVSDQTFLAEQTMTTEFTSIPEVHTESDRRRKNLLVVGSASAAVLLLGLIIYFCAGGSSADNKFTDRHKVMADNLFFRSSPSAQTDANIMTRLPYGSSVTLISTDDRWAEVECDGKHGYVGIRYILPDSTFRRLDQVWASSDVRDIADQNRYRQAIATYLESNHLETGPESWTIPYGNYKDAKPNTILSINLRNGLDKFPELAFILHNNSSGERRLVIYSFNPTDESPILIHEEISGYEGMIKDITLDRRGKPKVTYTGRKLTSQADTYSEIVATPSPEETKKMEAEAEHTQQETMNLINNLASNEIETRRDEAQETTIQTENQTSPLSVKEEIDDNQVYSKVETQAKFPGGNANMMRFIASNIHYPETAKREDIQGRVVVQVTIDKTGKVTHATVVRSVDRDLDREALRVAQKLPDFSPALIKGHPVASLLSIPISFKLQ